MKMHLPLSHFHTQQQRTQCPLSMPLLRRSALLWLLLNICVQHIVHVTADNAESKGEYATNCKCVCAPCVCVCVCLLRFSHWKLWHAKCVARTNQNSVLHKHEKKATPTTAATKVANQVQKACAQWYTQCEHDCNLTSSKDKASHTDTHKEVFCLPVGSQVFPSLRLCTSVR